MTSPDIVAPEFIQGPKARLAYRRRAGSGPTLVWLGGYRSDMLGGKAESLSAFAAETGRAFIRFDYSGHGESEGEFEECGIGDWAADALTVIDELTDGPLILIGSSMGGWVATLTALARPERIAGAVFIAPAPDFTERLMWPSLTDAQRETIIKDGRLETPSDYSDEPYVYTRRLIEQGKENLVMTGPIAIKAPVRILQGALDDAVPWRHALSFAEHLESEDVVFSLIKSGDHRLSEPDDLARLRIAVADLIRD